MQWTLVAPMLTAAGGGRGGRGGEGAAVGRPWRRRPPHSASDTARAEAAPARRGRGGGGVGAGPGSYVVKLTVNGRDYTKPVTVLEDKWMTER